MRTRSELNGYICIHLLHADLHAVHEQGLCVERHCVSPAPRLFPTSPRVLSSRPLRRTWIIKRASRAEMHGSRVVRETAQAELNSIDPMLEGRMGSPLDMEDRLQ